LKDPKDHDPLQRDNSLADEDETDNTNHDTSNNPQTNNDSERVIYLELEINTSADQPHFLYDAANL
jgi:hypothetical protein